MKTKLNTKTIVAAVASVIGLAVYGYTSMVGYLAASATSTLPVVLTVAALVCLALRQFAGSKLPAVVISAEHYLRYGMMGADVLSNLTGAASARGLYAIVDCRTTRPELWLSSPMAGDGFTVMPYVGGDCVPQDTDKAVFAVVRTANESSGEVQNLIAGDRPLYAAVAQQMARKGAALVVETGYSLDVKEVRKRAGSAFLLLPCCDGQNALPAFDDLGHGAMVVDYDLQYSGDVDAAIQEMKAWVNVL